MTLKSEMSPLRNNVIAKYTRNEVWKIIRNELRILWNKTVITTFFLRCQQRQVYCCFLRQYIFSTKCIWGITLFTKVLFTFDEKFTDIDKKYIYQWNWRNHFLGSNTLPSEPPTIKLRILEGKNKYMSHMETFTEWGLYSLFYHKNMPQQFIQWFSMKTLV